MNEAKYFISLPDKENEEDPNQENKDLFLAKIPNRDIFTKYDIKPHGICLGCMLCCHETHDVNELYSKMNFRCDCGNSHMPESC